VNSRQKGYYNEGKSFGDRDKSYCPYGIYDMARRSLWLAGWHDYQIEKGTGRK